jgi:hypothetical protein
LSKMYSTVFFILLSLLMVIIGDRGVRHRRRNIRETKGKRQKETYRVEETERREEGEETEK